MYFIFFATTQVGSDFFTGDKTNDKLFWPSLNLILVSNTHKASVQQTQYAQHERMFF